MSAYLVDAVNIGIIGKNLVDVVNAEPKWKGLSEEMLVRVLLTQNLRSLDARYPTSKGDLCAVLRDWDGADATPDNFVKRAIDEAAQVGTIDNTRLLDMLDNFAYQACETSDWQETLSYQAIEMLKQRI